MPDSGQKSRVLSLNWMNSGGLRVHRGITDIDARYPVYLSRHPASVESRQAVRDVGKPGLRLLRSAAHGMTETAAGQSQVPAQPMATTTRDRPTPVRASPTRGLASWSEQRRQDTSHIFPIPGRWILTHMTPKARCSLLLTSWKTSLETKATLPSLRSPLSVVCLTSREWSTRVRRPRV